MPPAIIISLLKGMGVNPEEFMKQMQSAFEKVNSFDTRLSNIEAHLEQLTEEKIHGESKSSDS